MPITKNSEVGSDEEQYTLRRKWGSTPSLKSGAIPNISPKWTSKKQRRGSVPGLEEELGNAHQKLEAVSDENQYLHNQFQDATDINNRLLFDVTKSLETINTLSHSLEECKSKLDRATQDKKHLSEELATSMDRVLELSRENEEWRIRVIDANDKMQSTYKELSALKERNEQLEREKEDMQEKMDSAPRPFWNLFRSGSHQVESQE